MASKSLCTELKRLIADEKKAQDEYSRFRDKVMKEIPEANTPLFKQAFAHAIISDESKHQHYLELLVEQLGCPL